MNFRLIGSPINLVKKPWNQSDPIKLLESSVLKTHVYTVKQVYWQQTNAIRQQHNYNLTGKEQSSMHNAFSNSSSTELHTFLHTSNTVSPYLAGTGSIIYPRSAPSSGVIDPAH